MFRLKKIHLFFLIALITFIFMYIDSCVFDKRRAVFTYIKNMIYCGLVAISVLMLSTKMSIMGTSPVNQSYNDPSNSYYGNYLPHNENILTGIPPNY